MFFFVNQYYPPAGAPTGRYLQDLARFLAASGVPVTVFCSRDEYGGKVRVERTDGVEIVRVGGFYCAGQGSLGQKIAQQLSFYVCVAWRLLRHPGQPSLIVALTSPPFLSLLVRWVARWRRCRYGEWTMELYPDAMVAYGMLPKNSLRHQVLQGLARWSHARSRLILALGPDMADRLHALVPSAPGKVHWIPLWSTHEAPVQEHERLAYRKRRGWKVTETVFLYSGNMGRGHRFGEFLQCIKQREGRGAERWVFSGGGARREELEGFASKEKNLPFELGDYVDQATIAVHLAAADVHLICLDAPWLGCMVPSKFQASFASGKPVILVGPRESCLARWIEESGGGWQVDPGDVASLNQAVDAALEVNERQRRGAKARRFARAHFNRETNLAAMGQLLRDAVEAA